MLEIDAIDASSEDVDILKGFSLVVKPGEVHAIMGPNGAGKSTLAKLLAAHPAYTIDSGTIKLFGEDISELEPEERASLGLFVGLQYPVEIPGVSNATFLHTALNAKRKSQGLDAVSDEGFEKIVEDKLNLLGMKNNFMERGVNEGFSGGEKKRNEILQLAVLDPKVIILDETDSGLDIDAMRVIAEALKKLMTPEKSLVLITHYQRLLDYIQPDFVHVMADGKIIESGDLSVASRLEKEGYTTTTSMGEK
jgi:Fe-S cluster assembly ATP-binding protein